ncbi:MAG: AraC family transcriptional regulator [Candidatus Aureabacteria bacterium]|nr:AraC family transcriptional regulator [Candidatus Auribacterota bacterium]
MKSDTEKVYRERILSVLIHIQRNLDRPLELEELSRIAYFSPFHFHRIFRGIVGESVKEHIRRLRLERAVLQLRATDRSILDIALDAGYETHESFTRAFRAMFGASPAEIRRDRRAVLIAGRLSGVCYTGEWVPVFNPVRGGGVQMKVRIEKVNPMRVAFMRHIGPYIECGETWSTFCAWAGPKGLLRQGVKVLGISHDDPEVTPADKLRYDACITVDESFKPEGEIGVQEVRGGEYAVTTHKGPYKKLIETYSALFGKWAPSSGRIVSQAPCFEMYLNDPMKTPPAELLTDIYVPLDPRR